MASSMPSTFSILLTEPRPLLYGTRESIGLTQVCKHLTRAAVGEL